MGQLLPYAPFPPDVIAAMEKLERAEAFDSNAFAVLDRERWKRAFAFLACVLPSGALGLLLIWVTDLSIPTLTFPTFLYGFGAFLFAIYGHHILRGDALRDDGRLGAAIGRWEIRAGQISDKPLGPKS
jgi:hypothetical protein